MKYLLLIILGVSFLFSCNDNSTEPIPIKDNNFNSAEEFIDNPSVKDAISESSIPINKGNNPPPLTGLYQTEGKIINGSPNMAQMVGTKFNSYIELYNQTNTGKISLSEQTAAGYKAIGKGGYITGDNGAFTVWIESIQEGKEAGLPNDVKVTVAFLLSGTKLNNGDLVAKGISIITKMETTNSDYKDKNIVGTWWMSDGNFYLQGNATAMAEYRENKKGTRYP